MHSTQAGFNGVGHPQSELANHLKIAILSRIPAKTDYVRNHCSDSKKVLHKTWVAM